ncbi:unnamed protein product [Moneuplotes crassus]|uniref:Uncharacterized protein n=1 Tax=Euplotes crassus TaxID=5936 RepID=A0AAD1TYP6_EUPCR|nr:unnamed protein product [Moneuplotes crassus]
MNYSQTDSTANFSRSPLVDKTNYFTNDPSKEKLIVSHDLSKVCEISKSFIKVDKHSIKERSFAPAEKRIELIRKMQLSSPTEELEQSTLKVIKSKSKKKKSRGKRKINYKPSFLSLDSKTMTSQGKLAKSGAKEPLNLEINDCTKSTSQQFMSANPSNFDTVQESFIEDKFCGIPSNNNDLNTNTIIVTTGDNKYACTNYLCLPVEERNLLWNVAREKKLETIRRIAKSNKPEECTFKPKLISNTHNKNNESNITEYSELASVSVQKYIARMERARDLKQQPKREASKKPGSGNLWKRKSTVPKGPFLRVNSGPREKDRLQYRSCDSLSRIISQNNLSIRDIDLDQRQSEMKYYCPESFQNCKFYV